MAFLKIDKKTSGTYLRIVESYREINTGSKHKTLYNLGKAEDYTKQALKRIGKTFMYLAGEEIDIESQKDLRELSRHNYGYAVIYDRILKIYGLDKLIKSISKKKKLKYNLYHSLLLMMVERLNDPSSKLSNYHHKHEYIGLEEIELHHLYKSLDQLYENQEKIQKIIYEAGRNLFNQQLDLVFYDVTTFYFESSKEDGYRMKGFNKDGRVGNTVIVFGMLIDKDKNPVGYRVYKGGQYEGHTFADAVRKLKQEYTIDKVIMVADRGMMNGTNIKFVSSHEIGYEFIIGERLKNLPKALQEKILDRSKFGKLKMFDEETSEIIEIEYLTIEHEGKRIITTYSESRAKKDKHEREEKIKKGIEYLKTPSEVEKKAAIHFLKKKGKNSYILDEDKIARSERFDGFISISTNTKNLTEAEVLDAYKQLYRIEHSFRTLKSYLETRPMFHWTDKRIEGHLCLCYICFTLLNYILQQMKRKGQTISENELRDIIGKMQVSLLEQSGEQYYLRSSMSEQTKMLLQVLHLKELPNVMSKNAITKYISIA